MEALIELTTQKVFHVEVSRERIAAGMRDRIGYRKAREEAKTPAMEPEPPVHDRGGGGMDLVVTATTCLPRPDGPTWQRCEERSKT